MECVDPETLLEWLQTGVGEERDMQLMALEHLCMLLLMSDNIDRCFESCPPRTFLPALCKILLDEAAPENVLEVTARAMTYYLDVSNECMRRISQVEGAVKAICNRLAVTHIDDRTSNDLAEQCVKVLELMCQREPGAIFEAGGLQCAIAFISTHGNAIHKDTLHSAMSVVTRLCSKLEPNNPVLQESVESLAGLLKHEDNRVCEVALRCFATLADRFMRKNMDPAPLNERGNLVDKLISTLLAYGQGNQTNNVNEGGEGATSSSVCIVISLISTLCRGSPQITDKILRSEAMTDALELVILGKDDRCSLDSLRLADLLLVVVCEGRSALPRMPSIVPSSASAQSLRAGAISEFERCHRHLIDSIRQKDTESLIEAIETGGIDVNFTDDVGQTLLNWASAFGTIKMAEYLCQKGADVNKGTPIGTVLSVHGPTRMQVGNWALESPQPGHLLVCNVDGEKQKTLIREEHPGFVFESNRGTKQTVTAESMLGPEFVTGWAARGGRKYRFRVEYIPRHKSGACRHLAGHFRLVLLLDRCGKDSRVTCGACRQWPPRR